MTLENPYKSGRHVTGQQFYGRADILRRLEQEDYDGAYIIGTRQIGKTSLLREIERRLPAFYLDLNSVAEDSLDQWANYLRRSINNKRAIYEWLPNSTVTKKLGFFGLLEHAVHAAEDYSPYQRIWLLFDEAEDLVAAAEEHPRLLAKLRGITAMLPNLCLVLAGYRNLLKLRQVISPHHSSPFLGGFISFILPPLSEEEAVALIRQDQMSPGVQVEDNVIKEILSETGGHPFLLQRLCNHLWREGSLKSPDDLVRYKLGADAENIFPADFKLLSEAEQQILLKLCQLQEATFAEMETILNYKTIHLSKTLQDLVDFGFIYHTSTAYAVSCQTLARWLASLKDSEVPIPLSDPIIIEVHSIDEREKRLKSRLEIHMKSLHHLQVVKAKYGFNVPVHIIHGIDEEEEAIRSLQQELEHLQGNQNA